MNKEPNKFVTEITFIALAILAIILALWVYKSWDKPCPKASLAGDCNICGGYHFGTIESDPNESNLTLLNYDATISTPIEEKTHKCPVHGELEETSTLVITIPPDEYIYCLQCSLLFVVEILDRNVPQRTKIADPNEPNTSYECAACAENFGKDETAIHRHICKGYPISRLIHQIEAIEQRLKSLEERSGYCEHSYLTEGGWASTKCLKCGKKWKLIEDRRTEIGSSGNRQKNRI